MNCAWNEFLTILPHRFREQIDKLGREKLEQLHLRYGQPAELIIDGRSHLLDKQVFKEDIQFVINAASRYSPWSSASIGKGYITASGGHRIGICGECVVQGGIITGIKYGTSLCIRVARELPGIGQNVPKEGSLLILGAPGVGKTTLLRDVVRLRSMSGQSVVVVDERGEIFPPGNHFQQGCRTDILTGCSKAQGVEMALKTMSPLCIAVDEITAQADCDALMSAAWCGVSLLATAHAESVDDLMSRGVYRSLRQCGLFTQAIVLRRDKSWYLERMKVCT